MEREEAARILEAILFVSDAPVTADNICTVIDGLDKSDIPAVVEQINGLMKDRALEVLEIAEGYQLRTKVDLGDWVKKFHKLRRSTRLSQASLETLSIVAYRQPITRQEIEDIRGVDSSGPVKTLLDKNLIKAMGRKKVPGKPMIFGTSGKFLEYFGLIKLSDLPALKDLPTDERADEPAQASIGFDETRGDEEKRAEDLLIEEEAALTEPAEEDYVEEANGDEAARDVIEDDGDKAAENSG